MTDGRLPLFVVTGFLGSGKTTFLRRVLREPELAGSLLLVNEVGELGVDDRLIRLDGTPAVLLGNGCLCCVANDGLGEALHRIVETRLGDGVTRVIVETTGLADPLPVLSTIARDGLLAARLRVDGIATLVDTLHAVQSEADGDDWARQVRAADVVLLSKTDLASPAQVAAVRDRLAVLAPLAPCLLATSASFVELVARSRDGRADRIARTRFLPVSSHRPRGHSPAHHAPDVRTFCVELPDDLDWIRLSVWLSLLLHQQGGAILRIKGFVGIDDHAAPVVLQCVHHVTYFPEHLSAWPDDERRSFLVFIVRGLSPDTVLRSLRACVGEAALLDEPETLDA